MKKNDLLTWVACMSMTCACGTDDPAEGNEPAPELEEGFGSNVSEDAAPLVGVWEWEGIGDEGERYRQTFQSDGFCLDETFVGDALQSSELCEWDVADGVLTVSYGNDGDETEKYVQYDSSTFAVGGDRLYEYVLLRETGTGSPLTGRWVNSSGGGGTWVGIQGNSERFEIEEHMSEDLTIEFDGDTFSHVCRAQEIDIENGEETNTTEDREGSGTVRIEGDAIYITTADYWRDLVEESDEPTESFLGFRITDDVISLHPLDPDPVVVKINAQS